MTQLATILVAEEGIGQLGINPWNLIFQLLAFIVLIFAFFRFVYRPILGTLDKRVAEQREIQDNSDRIKRELADATASSQNVLNQARNDAQQIINQSKTQAEQSILQAQQRAQVEYDARLQRASRDIDQQRDAAIGDLRRTFADLTIQAATKVVRRQLDVNPDTQRQLINDTLNGTVLAGDATPIQNNGGPGVYPAPDSQSKNQQPPRR